MTDINTITQNIFNNDLHQYTFNITSSTNVTNITDKHINHILNKKNYIVYKYENGLLLEYLLIKYAKYNMIQIFGERSYIDIIQRFSLFTDEIKPKNNISYNVKSTLVNAIIDNDVIRNKKKLYFEMLKYNPKLTRKYFAETCKLSELKNINDVYILRTYGNLDSGGGKNIYIVKSTDELNKIKKKVNIDKYIASKYITNPLLFKNRKFHLRVSFMIIYINNKISFSIFKHLRILQAKLSYINNDYLNKNIHDSHVDSTDDDYLFYNEFKNNKNYNKVITQIKIVIGECVNMAKPHIKQYSESKNGYRIFVADIMITDDYNVILIEINGSDSGYNFLNIKNHDIQILFNKDYFSWLFQKTIAPIFFPKLLLFNNNVNITNKYYDIIKNNNILTIKLNINYNDDIIYYIIIINLLCPYKKIYDITVLDLTNNILWKNTCDIIKCNYITNNDKKYDLIICNDLKNIINFKKYIIIEKFIKHDFYKGSIKFNDKKFYIYSQFTYFLN